MRTLSYARERRRLHSHDRLCAAGYQPVMVPLADLAHCVQNEGPGLRPSDPYIVALVAAYQRAQAGTGEWPPPIICARQPDGSLRYHDGNHRLMAARVADVVAIPALLFASKDLFWDAMDRQSETPLERVAREMRLQAAKQALAKDAAGVIRLGASERRSFTAMVASERALTAARGEVCPRRAR